MREWILIAVLACCAVTDVRRHRISNVCLGCGVCLGLVCVCGLLPFDCGGGEAGIRQGAAVIAGNVVENPGGVVRFWAAAWFLGRMVLVWVVGFPFFVMGMTGAGDIKAIGVIVAFLGLKDGCTAIAAGFCLGAILALGKMLSQGSVCQRFLYLSAYIRRVIQSRRIEKYYCRQRDGDQCVIPLGACFFAGAVLTVLWKG